MIKESKIFKPPGNDILSEDMKEYEGEYVVILNEEIVEHSKNISEIIKLSEKYPRDKAIITKIFPSGENLF